MVVNKFSREIHVYVNELYIYIYIILEKKIGDFVPFFLLSFLSLTICMCNM